MSISAEHDREHGCLTIRVQERFDFSVHKQFRDAYLKLPAPARSYVIDLAGTEEMDSSALGMLLLLREHAGGDRAEIRVVNASPAVRNILRIAGFGELLALH
nr:STAS domain-containing protein [Mizugakiibacter sediminis]